MMLPTSRNTHLPVRTDKFIHVLSGSRVLRHMANEEMLMKVVNLCPIRRIGRDFKPDGRQNGTRTPHVNKANIREKNWRW